ncbi:MAG: hypothetical protein HS115_07345 [Spirochaetales bacterium]|nr:hypothetical protein [Spirochaetales bacterium]
MRVIYVIYFLALPLLAQENLFSLSGPWKFSTVDQQNFSRMDLADQNWTDVQLPGNLSRAGKGGVFWLRKRVELSPDQFNGSVALVLGAVYDQDETYFNGELIGRRKAGYGHPRIYPLPRRLIHNGENVIAIRITGQFYDQIGITAGPLGLQIVSDASWQFLKNDIYDLIFAALFFISGSFFIILYRRMRQFGEYLWYGVFAISFGVQLFLRNEIRMDIMPQLFFPLKLAEQLSYIAMPTAFYFFFIKIFHIKPQGLLRSYPLFNAITATGILVTFSPLIWNYIISIWFLLNLPVFAFYLISTYRRAVEKREKTAIIIGVGILFMTINAIYYYATEHGWLEGQSSLSGGGLLFNLFVSVALIHRLIKLQQSVKGRREQLNTVNELRDRIFAYLHTIIRKPADRISEIYANIQTENATERIPELKLEIEQLQANLDDILELSRLEVISRPEYTEQVNFNDFITAVIPQNIITCHIKVNPDIVLSTSLELVNSIVIRLIDFPGFRRFRHIDLIITSDLKNNVHFRFLMFHPEFRHTRRLYELLTSENPDQSSQWVKWAIIRQIVRILSGELNIHIINRKYLRIDIKLPAFSTDGSQLKTAEIKVASTLEPAISPVEVTAEPVGKLRANMSLGELGSYIKSRLKRSA